jgi:hypothetical protein
MDACRETVVTAIDLLNVKFLDSILKPRSRLREVHMINDANVKGNDSTEGSNNTDCRGADLSNQVWKEMPSTSKDLLQSGGGAANPDGQLPNVEIVDEGKSASGNSRHKDDGNSSADALPTPNLPKNKGSK